MCSSINSQLKSYPTEIDMYLWASRGSLEFIAQGGLGTSLDTLKEGESSNYTLLIKEMVYVFLQFSSLILATKGECICVGLSYLVYMFQCNYCH